MSTASFNFVKKINYITIAIARINDSGNCYLLQSDGHSNQPAKKVKKSLVAIVTS
ncbi:hypothetical protein [Gloeocapsopsis sp. IPPAS B-1203]|uniref:hypothetical protein n=1 Tax=Gloeocapsopsis sp. IPPAS B-1203 TaxID=2049454 RepID=UPI0025A10E8D|nr:hypothetical protein [Gloeocapsopsis sp. IPPAS B-1203]